MIETFSLLASLFHYGILVIFGVALTAAFLNIPKSKKDFISLILVSVMLILLELAVFLVTDVETVMKLYPVITHLPLILFFVFIFKRRVFQTTTSLMIAYLCCQIISWLELVMRHIHLPDIAVDLSASFLLVILAFFIITYFAASISKLLNYHTKELLIYAMIPFIYYVYDYIATVYAEWFLFPNNITVEFMPFVISLAFLIFSVVYHKQFNAYYEAKQKSQLLSIQLKQYESMRTKIEETRIARHDLKQHVRLLTAYIENNDTESLAKYIKSYGESLPADIEQRFCENNVVDTIVRFYAAKSQENNIQFETNLYIPENLNLVEADLCVLLGNLLENALDECLKHPEKACKIKLSGRLRGTRTLIITVDNTPSAKPSMSDGILLSSKPARSGSGLGTYSVKNIAERYQGDAKFEWKQGVFYASVILMLPA